MFAVTLQYHSAKRGPAQVATISSAHLIRH